MSARSVWQTQINGAVTASSARTARCGRSVEQQLVQTICLSSQPSSSVGVIKKTEFFCVLPYFRGPYNEKITGILVKYMTLDT